MSNIDKEVENFLGDFFSLIFNTIKSLFLNCFKGIKNLNKRTTIVPFLLTIYLSVLIYIFRDKYVLLPFDKNVNKGIFIALFCMPVFYLFILGCFTGKDTDEYDEKFATIRFKSRDGKYPQFCGSKMEGKKQHLTFKSTIPLSEWKKNKEYLESAFDCNILKIKSTSSKNFITLTTVPSDCIIPEFIAWKDAFRSGKDGVITIGISALSTISFDLNKNPHILIAGETGSGKSVILRCCLWQMALQGARVIMIDFKGGVEFGKQYRQFGEVITKRERAVEVLELLTRENEARLELFNETDVKNIQEYNRSSGEKLCRIGVFCDEIAEMLDKKGVSKNDRVIYEKLEAHLSTLARLSRATGINLFLGTQRPDANIITGQIKTNIPLRVSGRFADKAASEIVLGATDATDLPDIKGRFMFKQGADITEFQSYYFDDNTALRSLDIAAGRILTPGLGNDETLQTSTDQRKATQPRAKPMKKNPPKASDSGFSQSMDIDTQSTDWEAMMREMDAYDLNLDFGKEEMEES